MIFDLLTVRDIYDRVKLYPNSNGTIPFQQTWSGISGNADFYEIEEGCYFELPTGGYNNRHYAELPLSKILPEHKYYSALALKIRYRSSKGIRLYFMDTYFEMPKSDTLTTVSFVINNTVDWLDRIDIWDETFNTTNENFPAKGEYLIINNLEIVCIKS